jgi:hypothetical protein
MDIRNLEVLQPYLNSEIYNEIFDLEQPPQFVINFRSWPLEQAQSYPEVFRIVDERVRPQREKMTGQIHEHRFWLHWDKRERFFEKYSNLSSFLIAPITTKYLSFVLFPQHWFFSHAVKVFGFERYNAFAVLQSSIHDAWARRESSNLGTTLRYSTSDVFDTFAFSNLKNDDLERIGHIYHGYRQQIMLNNQDGLTATYNKFHSPDDTAEEIRKLRELHKELDYVVAATYGWDDIDLEHNFYSTTLGIRYTIAEPARRTVLTRLLELNHARYAEEVKAGLHDKKGKGKSKSKGDVADGQLEMW